LNSYTNQDHNTNRTLEVKRGDGEDNVLNGKSNGAVGSLHETDLFKIAVRNLSE